MAEPADDFSSSASPMLNGQGSAMGLTNGTHLTGNVQVLNSVCIKYANLLFINTSQTFPVNHVTWRLFFLVWALI